MNTAAETLLEFWEDPRNIPFRGSLISEEPPKGGGVITTCMCAQGQALYIVGGYSVEDLRNTTQVEADTEVAKLLGISVAHSMLLRSVNDSQDGAPSNVLTNPGKYLGENYKSVLDFWHRVGSLSEHNRNKIAHRFLALDPDTLRASWLSTIAAHEATNPAQAASAAWEDSWRDTLNFHPVSFNSAVLVATWELIVGTENPVSGPLFDIR